MSNRALIAVALSALLAPRLAAQQVLVVGGLLTPVPHFDTVQAAVDAAADGDVILIEPGFYDLQVVLDDRALVLAGLTNPAGKRAGIGSLVIRNLAPTHPVVVRGLDLYPAFTGETLAVLDCDGPVLLEDVQVSEFINAGTLPSRIERSEHVVLSRCTLHGTRGTQIGVDPGFDGGMGLLVVDASVALYDSLVHGGNGAGGTFSAFATPIPGTNGGTAMRILAGTVLLAGTEVRGGSGGDAYTGGTPCAPPGDGNTGLEGDGLLRRLDSVIAGGAAGATAGCPRDGTAGTALAFSGTLITVPQALRRLQISSPIEEGGSCTFALQGQPLEPVLLLQSLAPLGSWLGGVKGTLAGAPPLAVYALGATGADGVLAFDVPIPTGLLPPGIEGILLVDQAVTAAAGGGGLLSSPSSVMLVTDLP